MVSKSKNWEITLQPVLSYWHKVSWHQIKTLRYCNSSDLNYPRRARCPLTCFCFVWHLWKNQKTISWRSREVNFVIIFATTVCNSDGVPRCPCPSRPSPGRRPSRQFLHQPPQRWLFKDNQSRWPLLQPQPWLNPSTPGPTCWTWKQVNTIVVQR